MSNAEHEKRQVELGEQLLDDMARKRASETGRTFEKAYAEVLQTPEGRRVHEAMHVHGADSERGAVAKRSSAPDAAALAKAGSAEAAIERLAKAAQRPGEAYEVAYDRVVQSGEGRRLYFEYCEAVEAAGK